MKLLVTGAGGFVGGHLLELLRREEPKVRVHGVVSPHGGLSRAAAKGVRFVEADLHDAAAAAAVVEDVRPDAVVHLAGRSSVQQSWLDPGGTLRTNVLGLVHLLDAVRRAGLKPAVLVVGSAEEYGVVAEDELPIRETTPLRPASPYAVSKVAQAALARALRSGGRDARGADADLPPHRARPRRGLRRELLRPPDRRDRARPAAAGDRGGQSRRRARLHRRARRGARLPAAARQGRRGPGLQRLQRARAKGPRAARAAAARVDGPGGAARRSGRLRPSDVPVQVGDPSRLQRATGWEPRIPLEQSLADLLEDWRARVAGAAGVAP